MKSLAISANNNLEILEDGNVRRNINSTHAISKELTLIRACATAFPADEDFDFTPDHVDRMYINPADKTKFQYEMIIGGVRQRRVTVTALDDLTDAPAKVQALAKVLFTSTVVTKAQKAVNDAAVAAAAAQAAHEQAQVDAQTSFEQAVAAEVAKQLAAQ